MVFKEGTPRLNMILLGEKTETLVVIAAFGEYEAPAPSKRDRVQLPSLGRIAPTITRLKALLATERYRAENFETICLSATSSKYELLAQLDQLREALKQKRGLNLVMFWSGHGGLIGRSFRLATSDTYEPIEQDDGVGVDDLLRASGLARVDTYTLVLDTCYSSASFDDIAKSISSQLMDESDRFRGFGALFSSAPYERARDSVLLSTVIDLLESGPSAAAQRFAAKGPGRRINPYHRLLSVSELFEAVSSEYEAAPTRFFSTSPPKPFTFGTVCVFPNPLWRPNQHSRLVEDVYQMTASATELRTHFFPKASGVDGLETGWHFSGRVEPTRAILKWIAEPQSNGLSEHIFVLVADGGVGKSALLGRLISLADTDYRTKATAQGWNELREHSLCIVPDPNSIDAALNLSNLTAQSAVHHLAAILTMHAGGSIEDFVESARWARVRADGRDPCIIFDALDEADEPVELVRQLLLPLARANWKLLVATRRTSQARGVRDILALLEGSTILHLDKDVRSRADIQEYAKSRLSKQPELQSIAGQAAQLIAERSEDKFLFARMATSTLLRHASKVTSLNFASFIASDAMAVFDKDIAELDEAFRKHFHRSDRGATAMLLALAWGQGNGLPIRDGIWAAIAGALSPEQTDTARFEPVHLTWFLIEAGRYILEAGDGEQAVYRLFHRSLVEHLCQLRTPEQVAGRVFENRVALALEVYVPSPGGWAKRNPYLIRHLPAHFAMRVGQTGLNEILQNFDWIKAKLRLSGIDSLLKDYDYCEQAWPSTAQIYRLLSMVSHILRDHPDQLTAQILGRIDPNSVSERSPSNQNARRGLNQRLLNREVRERKYRHLLQPVPTISARQLGALIAQARISIRVPMFVPELGGLEKPGALIRILSGHNGAVTCLAVSSDGKMFVSGGADGVVKIWDAVTEKALHTLAAHKGAALCVALGPDGNTVLSGGLDGIVIAWNALAGTMLYTLVGHKRGVYSLVMTPNGQFIVSAGNDQSVRVWDTRTRAVWKKLHALVNGPGTLCVASDCATIFLTSFDGIRSWDLRTGVAGHFKKHPESDLIKRRRRRLVRPVIDDTKSGLSILTVRAEPLLQILNLTALSEDLNTLVVAAGDGTVLLNSVGTRPIQWVKKLCENSPLSSIAVSSDGQTIVTGQNNGTLAVWDAGIGECRQQSLADDVPIVKLAVSSNGKILVSGAGDGTVRVWDASVTTSVDRLGDRARVSCVAAGSTSNKIFCGYDDGTIRHWNEQTRQLERVSIRSNLGGIDLKLPKVPELVDMAISLNGKTLVASNILGGAMLLFGSGKGLQSFGRLVSSVGVWPDGRRIVLGGTDGTVRLWSTRFLEEQSVLLGHDGLVTSVAVSADGTTLISASEDGTVVLWDSVTGIARHRLCGHRGPVRSAVMSSDGQIVVSGGDDSTVRVWDALTGFARHVLLGHGGEVLSVAAGVDGCRLVSGGVDRTLRVWDTRSGVTLQRTDLDAPVVGVVSVRHNGVHFVLAGAGQRIVRMYEVDPDTSPTVN